MRFPITHHIERGDEEIELSVIYDVSPFVPAMVAALRQVVNLAELHIAERSATPEEEEDFLSCAYLVNARAILSRIDGAGEALPDTPAPDLAEAAQGDTCTGCGRESFACSLRPCPDVIADREA